MSESKVYAERYHDISCGHRVVGHEGKCALLHGHNYRIHFKASAPRLDKVGRVIDFSVLKSTLCQFLEDTYDHKFLAWNEDEWMRTLTCTSNDVEFAVKRGAAHQMLLDSIVWVPFNPTAENIAVHLLEVVGPRLLSHRGVTLVSVRVEETHKCSASVELE